MPVVLDPDAAAVYKAFQEAGRPPYETVSPTEARELYLKGRFVTNPEPPELASVKEIAIPGPGGANSGAGLHAEDAAAKRRHGAMPGVFPRRRLGDRQSQLP